MHPRAMEFFPGDDEGVNKVLREVLNSVDKKVLINLLLEKLSKNFIHV